MPIQEVTQGADAGDARIRELTEENKLLFEQLHVVQEELERYYHKLKDCEQRNGSSANTDSAIMIIPPEVGEALEENLKLRALVTQQQAALRIESTNSLAARLGNILIKGVSSAGSFIALPLKLCRLWKALEQSPPLPHWGARASRRCWTPMPPAARMQWKNCWTQFFFLPQCGPMPIRHWPGR